MAVQYTTNYHIAYMDDQTALTDLDVVTQAIATSLDDAMGRAGYTPPDATSFAAEVAARVALAGRVTTLEADTRAGDTIAYAAVPAAANSVVYTTGAAGTEARAGDATLGTNGTGAAVPTPLSFAVALTAGRVYRVEAQGRLNAGVAATAAVLNVRGKSGAAPVVATSTLLAHGLTLMSTTGTGGRVQGTAAGRFTVPTTGTYQLAVFLSGASLSLLTDARGLADVVITDQGPSAGLTNLPSIV